MWGGPTDAILFVARSIEHVAASDHETGADEAPLGSNGWPECRPSLPQLFSICKKEPFCFICSLSKKVLVFAFKDKGHASLALLFEPSIA